MDKVFDSLSLIDEYVIECKSIWSTLPTPEKLVRLRKLTGMYPDNEPLGISIKLYVEQWEREQQQIANKHINLYTNNSGDLAGYRFMGFAINSTKQKWIICGTDEFIDKFKNIKDRETADEFSAIFNLKKGSVDQTHVRHIDTTYASNRIYREMEIKSNEIVDSNWCHCE